MAAYMFKWSAYLDLINTSLAEVPPSLTGDCGAHTSVIDADLAVWKDRGGIFHSDFLAAKDSRFRGVHYLIVDHTLYREPECMFTPRYVQS